MDQRLDDAAESYLDWWALAGIDQVFAEEPIDRFAPVAPARPDRQVSPAIDPTSATVLAPPPPPRQPVPSAWSIERIDPSGPPGAALLVLIDMPGHEDFAAGTLLAGADGALFDRMLAAIELTRGEIAMCSIAPQRHASGRLPRALPVGMREAVKRHVRIAAPRIVLVMGDATSQALLGEPIARSEGRLRDVNYDGALLPTVATFHPRALAAQTALKAAAWKTLLRVQNELAGA